ncbi:MAG: RNA polymerase sigma factor [Candidatus Poribacteria bacterium]|nr:RNA polymerase sigma factor [Candidatus Poribacteria bacterium]
MIDDEKARDIELVRKIRDGDENAFTELHRRYRPNIYNYIAKKIEDRQDAEELVQDTFMKVWQHIHTLNEPDKVLNWMYRIAAQLIAGWHRKQKSASRRGSSVDVYEAEGDIVASTALYQTAEETAFIAERFDTLDKAIAQLPERDQRMIRLQSDGHSYEEIAEIRGETVSAVKNRLSRAKQKLKVWAEAWKKADAEGLDMEFSEVHEKKGK